MADSTLVLEVDAKTGKAERSVKDLGTAIDSVQDSVDELADKMDEGFKSTGDAVEAVSDKVEKVSADFSGFSDMAKEQFGGFTDTLKDAIPGFDGIKDGLKSSSGGFKTLKGAIASTGLGILVIILGQLVQYFQENEKAMDALEVVTNSVSAVFSGLQKTIEPLGDFLINIFTQPQVAMEQFRGALEGIRNWFGSLYDFIMESFLLGIQKFKVNILEARIAWNTWTGDYAEAEQLTDELATLNLEIEETTRRLGEAGAAVAEPFVKLAESIAANTMAAYEAGGKLAKLRKSVRKSAMETEEAEARLQKTADAHRRTVDDQTTSYEEKTAALKAARSAEAEILKLQREDLDLQIRLQQQEIKMAKSKDDRKDAEEELSKLITERTNLEAESAEAAFDYQDELKELELDELDRKRDIAEMIRDERLNATKDTLEAQRELERKELAIDEADALRELEELQATEEEKQQLREAYAAQRATLEEEFAKEDAENAKSRAESLQALEDELLSDKLEAQLAARLAQLEREEIEHLEDMRLLGANEEELESVRDKYRKIRAKAEKDTAKEIAERDAELLAKRIDNQLAFAGGIMDIVDTLNNRQEQESESAARKQFKVNQALQVGQATINTASAVTAQLAVPQDVLTGANFVKAGLALAQGAAQIAAIKAQKFDSSQFALDEVESPRVNTGGGDFASDIDLSFLQQDFEQGGGIRAYVVNQEIESASALAQALEDRARL